MLTTQLNFTTSLVIPSYGVYSSSLLWTLTSQLQGIGRWGSSNTTAFKASRVLISDVSVQYGGISSEHTAAGCSFKNCKCAWRLISHDDCHSDPTHQASSPCPAPPRPQPSLAPVSPSPASSAATPATPAAASATPPAHASPSRFACPRGIYCPRSSSARSAP